MFSQRSGEYLCQVDQSGQERLAVINAANTEHIDALILKLNLSAGLALLDIGCGVGDITLRIARQHPDVWITAVDISVQQIDIAKARAIKEGLTNINFIVLSAYDIASLSSSFDRIFIRWVLGHLSEPQKVLDACRHLLKKEGVLVCEEGNINTHSCVTVNTSHQQRYRFFVDKVMLLQTKRDINPAIGATLAEFVGVTFPDSERMSANHQIKSKDKTFKRSVSTLFLNEIERKLIDNHIMSEVELAALKSDLAVIADSDEAEIHYTADTYVVMKIK